MAIVQSIKVPLISVNDTTLTVVEINFKNGDAVKKNDTLLVFETSKTTYEAMAEADGFVGYYCQTGAEYAVNTEVAKIYSSKEEIDLSINSKEKENHIASSQADAAITISKTVFSFSALQLMDQHKIDQQVFKGHAFVDLQQVKTYLGIADTGTTSKQKNNALRSQAPAAAIIDETKVVFEKLPKNKLKEIDYLSGIQHTGLTSTINVRINIEGLFVQLNNWQKKIQGSLLPITIFETGRLLKKYKKLNAYFVNNGIAYYKEVHIGFAIDIDKGLKVLAIKNADEKSIYQIEEEILQLSEQYIEDKIPVSSLTDIGFTVTDLSAEGVSSFRPLVNAANSAILGISAVDEALQSCTYSVTFDHRVTEGKLVAGFLNELKIRIESYAANKKLWKPTAIHCYKCFKKLEEDLANVGFVQCITPLGEQAYICQACFKGF